MRSRGVKGQKEKGHGRDKSKGVAQGRARGRPQPLDALRQTKLCFLSRRALQPVLQLLDPFLPTHLFCFVLSRTIYFRFCTRALPFFTSFPPSICILEATQVFWASQVVRRIFLQDFRG